MLTDLAGTWTLTDGPMLRSGSLGVRLLPPDSDDHRHLDFEILLNADNPAVPTITDCSVGRAADPEEAARQAIQAWTETCLVTVLEMIDQKGRFASHFRATAEGGFAGQHTIVGSVTGWSLDGSDVKQQWFADAKPWSTLAPLITPALDRPHLNGLRLLVGQGSGVTECEVRVNGRRHEPAAEALAALDWPRTETFGLARTFVLLVGPH
jgi:hypothetical protein